jgi:hypothetical protein
MLGSARGAAIFPSAGTRIRPHSLVSPWCDDRLALRLYRHSQIWKLVDASAPHGTASNSENPPISVLAATTDADNNWAIETLSANSFGDVRLSRVLPLI